MADILIQKDSSTLIRKTVTSAERLTWAQDFTIYDVNADNSRGAAFGPTRGTVKPGAVTADPFGALSIGPDGRHFALINASGAQTVAAIGDSLQAQGFTRNVSAQINATTALNFLLCLLEQRATLPFGCSSSYTSGAADIADFCLAVSGTTTQQAIDSQIGPAALLGANIWSVQSGTNDLTLRAADTVAQITARLQTICEAGLAAGARIWLWTLPPRNDSSGASAWNAAENLAAIGTAGSTVAAQRAKHMEVNQWIRTYARATPGITLLDPYYQLIDLSTTTDEWRSGLAIDAVHWGSAGGFEAAMAVLPAARESLKQIATATNSQADTYGASNLTGNAIPTPAFQGAGGSVSGTGISGAPPTGHTVDIQTGTLTPGTAVVLTQARTDVVPGTTKLVNGREMQVTIAGTAPGAFQLRAYQAASASVPANTPFYVEWTFSVSANAAAIGFPSLQAFINSGAVNSIGMAPDAATLALPVGSTYKAVIRTPWMQHTAATSGLAFAQLNGVAGSQAVFKFLAINLRPASASNSVRRA